MRMRGNGAGVGVMMVGGEDEWKGEVDNSPSGSATCYGVCFVYSGIFRASVRMRSRVDGEH